MYIESRFYDNGTAKAMFHRGFDYPKIEDDKTCDIYIESINPHPEMKVANAQYLKDDSLDEYDFNSLEEWVEKTLIPFDDISSMVAELKKGGWVDISAYC